MLVISRRIGEQIQIGDSIVITVIEIDRGKVKLGIEAPKDVSITRPDYVPKEKPEGET